ncbi:MAG: oxygen-independent coproporphyrinogen III oxidase-like protein [Burkholderiales bacterium]|nr:oxygen-independent coproporphyrinogen III oxidase-like protein [Burkholderiales bacterium]
MPSAPIVLDAGGVAASGVRTPRGPRFASLPPLSLYIHIPWCVRKCPYCDFNSHELRAALPEREYVDALIADLEQLLPRIWGRGVYTIFFGGGTPSLFSPRALDTVLQAVRARVRLDAAAEITLEANPGTVDTAHFEGYRAAGVNRLSIGVQSFDDAKLNALGRIHGAAQARRAIELAQRHFPNVNVDIMYALPDQTLANALVDIETAIAFGPAHISAYHLTIEPNTLFYRTPPPLPDGDAAAEMQDAIEACLGEAGYEHYETSAFARAGFRCAHNLNYWRFGDYVGIGAGAHGKISFPDRIVREVKYKNPRQYMARAAQGAIREAHEVSARDLPFEFMLNALRLTEGIALQLYEERTGLPLTSVLAALDAAERDGLIECDHRLLRPSARGRRFLNDLLQRFLPQSGA